MTQIAKDSSFLSSVRPVYDDAVREQLLRIAPMLRHESLLRIRLSLCQHGDAGRVERIHVYVGGWRRWVCDIWGIPPMDP